MDFVEFRYDDDVDHRLIPLYNAIQSLPGIEISCIHRDLSENFSVWIDVIGDKYGLFFLTRCVDRRYWNHGYEWRFELSVGDRYIDNHLPITYRLHPTNGIYGEDLNQQIISLVDNMNHHLNHEAFMTGFDLTDLFEDNLTEKRMEIRDNLMNTLIFGLH